MKTSHRIGAATHPSNNDRQTHITYLKIHLIGGIKKIVVTINIQLAEQPPLWNSGVMSPFGGPQQYRAAPPLATGTHCGGFDRPKGADRKRSRATGYRLCRHWEGEHSGGVGEEEEEEMCVAGSAVSQAAFRLPSLWQQSG